MPTLRVIPTMNTLRALLTPWHHEGRAGRGGFRNSRRLLLVACCALFAVTLSARGDEPFLKKGDVIALVGGEDMVVAGELGYLELLLTRALPDFHLRFRSLAWEGDTVFEQRRDLNFPPLEAQLDQIGATVVLCQFGQMESLGGKEKLPEFIAAYEKLLTRFSGGGKRRVVILSPCDVVPKEWDDDVVVLDVFWSSTEPSERNKTLQLYRDEMESLSKKQQGKWVDPTDPKPSRSSRQVFGTRDGVHLTEGGLKYVEVLISGVLGGEAWVQDMNNRAWNYAAHDGEAKVAVEQSLIKTIRAKNRLWFDYWRVQNWAFLAGDRTEQPSSRDWRDPTQRWFPAEREQFLPLIEAKEREIDALAAQLAAKP